MVKSSEKLARQMAARGWTMAQVEEAVERRLSTPPSVARQTAQPRVMFIPKQGVRS
jgi:hypothetical protein